MAGVEAPDTRFTQANERTFLAWNRTALAFIAGGLAVEQFVEGSRAARLVVAIPLILLGGFVGVAGYARWKEAEQAIRRGEELPPSRVPRLLALAFVLLTVGALALVIASSR
jgi:putative membrane protein